MAFELHEVADGLWVGPCPSSPERIRTLRARGITGLISVQTDEDLGELGMSWPLMWRFLMAQGISSQRLPIVDFDERALSRGLPEAVAAVHEMRSGGHPTYVHCTAGINRSPTVAIAYLMRHHDLELEAAWTRVTERRPSVPNRPALTRWHAAQKPLPR